LGIKNASRTKVGLAFLKLIPRRVCGSLLQEQVLVCQEGLEPRQNLQTQPMDLQEAGKAQDGAHIEVHRCASMILAKLVHAGVSRTGPVQLRI
jgi:hypothetical protein